MSSDFIVFNNVSYAYNRADDGKDIAVDNISLSIKKGSVTAILGRNGSGKSTIARLMNGLLRPNSGEVTVDGISTAEDDNIWEIRKRVGMIFQNPDNQIIGTTVCEDVAFGVENLGTEPSEIRKRVYDAIKAVDMEEYADSAPHKLSGGQKQRVSMAGVLAMNTECIIMDESTAMLDPLGRKEVLDMVLKLNREKKITVVLITHYMDEAFLADHVLVIGKGKIVMEGTPRDVFRDVDKVRNAGMDLPYLNKLLYEIKNKGFDIDTDVVSVEEAYEMIDKYIEGEKI